VKRIATDEPSEEGALRREALSALSCAAGPDGREGVAAFVATRPVRFPSAGP
jgi:2-(1,2-epoxy-1,2-dihydrophenyl)acetyl-CoA isomerase